MIPHPFHANVTIFYLEFMIKEEVSINRNNHHTFRKANDMFSNWLFKLNVLISLSYRTICRFHRKISPEILISLR